MFLVCRQEESRTRSSPRADAHPAITADVSMIWKDAVSYIRHRILRDHGIARSRVACLASRPTQWLVRSIVADTGGMLRISVVGNSGSGKTTIASAIAATLGVPHLELDAVSHQTDWQPSDTDEFR